MCAVCVSVYMYYTDFVRSTSLTTRSKQFEVRWTEVTYINYVISQHYTSERLFCINVCVCVLFSLAFFSTLLSLFRCVTGLVYLSRTFTLYETISANEFLQMHLHCYCTVNGLLLICKWRVIVHGTCMSLHALFPSRVFVFFLSIKRSSIP